MTGNCCSIKWKANGRVITVKAEEGMFQIVRVEEILVVIDDVRHVEEHLIKAKLFDLPTPGKTFEVSVQELRGISEPTQLFPEHYNKIRNLLFSLADQLELVQSPATGLVIACHHNLLLGCLEPLSS